MISLPSKQLLVRGSKTRQEVLAVDNPLAATPVSFLRPTVHERPAPIGTAALLRIAIQAQREGYRIASLTLDQFGEALDGDDDLTAALLGHLRRGDEMASRELMDEGVAAEVLLRFVALDDPISGLRLTLGRDGVLLVEGPSDSVQQTVSRFVELLNRSHDAIGIT